MQALSVLSSPPLAGLPFRGWDFIYAAHPDPGESPNWYTEKRFPLNGDLVAQGTYLYGVRFGPTTQYAMVDIDVGSPYHPRNHPHAWRHICESLEPLGLVRFLLCQSSDSEGLHIYFPWAGPGLRSWQVGLVLTTLLESKGFKCGPGRLEIFPNLKAYRGAKIPSLYNAHRLPLQSGFYLLNDSLEPVWTTEDRFVHRWHLAAQANDIDEALREQLLKQHRRRQYPVSTSAETFLNDLNAAIEPGWERTDDDPPFLWEGQAIIPKTNSLLGRIAMRAYIFGHIDGRRPPLEGEALIDEIVSVAMGLPGYETHCRHRHEIRKRATHWARCVEASHYFHYGCRDGKRASDALSRTEVGEISWHEQQGMAARDRIRTAIATLLDAEQFPAMATARARCLVERCQMSLATLYKNCDLWHPDFISPGGEDDLKTAISGVFAKKSDPPDDDKSLLDEERCNCSESNEDSGIRGLADGEVSQGEACNAADTETEGGHLTGDREMAQVKCVGETISETIERVKQLLQKWRHWQDDDDFSVDSS